MTSVYYTHCSLSLSLSPSLSPQLLSKVHYISRCVPACIMCACSWSYCVQLYIIYLLPLFPPSLRIQLYGQLFFLLQTSPEYIAHLTRMVSLKEIDGLLQIVMFTLYGNQYEDREEHLLLSMFEVRTSHGVCVLLW